MALVRRQKAENGVAIPVPDEGSKAVLARYPTLAEWLSSGAWPDGAPRVTGTIMIFIEDGRWKAWLHDRDAEEGCFVSGDTSSQLFNMVEKLLESGGGDWRKDQKKGKR